MRAIRGCLSLLVVGPLLLISIWAQADEALPTSSEKVVRLASLDWPPYTGAGLFKNGINSWKLREILKQGNVRLEIDFMPWRRVLQEGTGNPHYAGYFPEYAGAGLKCRLSLAYDSSQVGFVQRKTAPKMRWKTMTDLQDYEIGVVDGYINDGGAFDAAISTGALEVQKTANDLLNLRKVAAGRLDAAVIDPRVMDYLVRHHMPHMNGKMVMHQRLLRVHGLHVCAQDNPDGQLVLSIIKKVVQARWSPTEPEQIQ